MWAQESDRFAFSATKWFFFCNDKGTSLETQTSAFILLYFYARWFFYTYLIKYLINPSGFYRLARMYYNVKFIATELKCILVHCAAAIFWNILLAYYLLYIRTFRKICKHSSCKSLLKAYENRWDLQSKSTCDIHIRMDFKTNPWKEIKIQRGSRNRFRNPNITLKVKDIIKYNPHTPPLNSLFTFLKNLNKTPFQKFAIFTKKMPSVSGILLVNMLLSVRKKSQN